ncbi:MAG: hypothetical protein ACOZFS_00165 [Thermodesulfobacteriota bacterium]
MLSFKLLSLVVILVFWPYVSWGGQTQKITGTYKIEDLGKIIQSATLEHRFQVHLLQTDQTHLLLYYVLKDCGKQPFQILDVNLNNGQTRVADAILGRPGPVATILHSNGLIYIGSGAPGYFMVYNPETGQTRQIANLAEGAQYIIEGDDGAIYIGECTKGYVERYDPKTQAWENYGIIDDPGPPYYRYAYSLGADERYIYIAIGQKPWYLAIFDRQNRSTQLFWKELNPTFVGVSRGKDGRWYSQCFAKEGKRWYRLNGQRPPELIPKEPVLTHGWLTRLPQPLNAYEVDLTQAYPDSGNEGKVMVRWRRRGQIEWREATVQVRLGPIDIKRLYAWDDNRLLGFTSFYGPVFLYDPAKRQTTFLGRTERSLYDALFSQGRWWLAGYPTATMVYDPLRPWTLTASTKDLFSSLVNPHLLRLPPDGSAKYHYYLAAGTDNCIYIGGHRERDSVGGTLGWYNPHTRMTGGLRQPFLQYEIRDLLPIINGTKILISTVARDRGTDGKLFLFNCQQKKLEAEFLPLSGETDAGKVVEIEPGLILGLIRGSPKSRVYKFDLQAGKLVFVKDLDGKMFGEVRSYDRRAIKGPDGHVWLYIDNTICRINPADGTVQRVLEALPAGNLLFFKNDLYIYGDYNLRRVSNIFTEALPKP